MKMSNFFYKNSKCEVVSFEWGCYFDVYNAARGHPQFLSVFFYGWKKLEHKPKRFLTTPRPEYFPGLRKVVSLLSVKEVFLRCLTFNLTFFS